MTTILAFRRMNTSYSFIHPSNPSNSDGGCGFGSLIEGPKHTYHNSPHHHHRHIVVVCENLAKSSPHQVLLPPPYAATVSKLPPHFKTGVDGGSVRRRHSLVSPSLPPSTPLPNPVRRVQTTAAAAANMWEQGRGPPPSPPPPPHLQPLPPQIPAISPSPPQHTHTHTHTCSFTKPPKV